MTDLIQRYIYDVTRRLNKDEREDVKKELESNIYDMLPEDASEGETIVLLEKLGSPAELANKYRQNPRYLISPSVYEDYIRVLKFLVPLLAVILAIVGAALGIISAVNSQSDTTIIIAETIARSIEMGASGALAGLVWTTIGFVIYDRTDDKKSSNWSYKDLPELEEEYDNNLPMTDLVVEIVMLVIGTIIGLLLITGQFTLVKDTATSTIIKQLFSEGFLKLLVPLFLVTCALNIVEVVVKLKDRYYSALVCITYLICNISNMAIAIFLFTRKNIFSSELINYINNSEYFDQIQMILNQPFINPVFALSAIVIIATLIGCGITIYKTIKTKKKA